MDGSMPTKALHRKSRNGCLNCKSKRIKCDQKSPSCVRCEERGVECPGYALNLRWAPKNQLHPPSPLPAFANSQHSMSAQASGGGSPANVRHRRSPLLPPKPGLTDQPSMNMDARMLHDWFSGSIASPLPESPLGTRFSTSPGAWSYDSLFPTHPPMSPNNLSLEGQLPLIPEPQMQPWHHGSVSSEALWNGPPLQEPVLLDEFDTEDVGMDKEEEENEAQIADEVAGALAMRTSSFVEPTSSPKGRQITAVVSLPQDLVNVPSALCDYFFKEVITLYCAWDSRSNIMRVVTETMWQSSSVLYHTMQSMAAACLANTFPELKKVAIKEHMEAVQYLVGSSSIDEDKMLASFLLGHTASWINPNNLATDSYEAALVRLDSWVAESTDHTNLHFYGEAMDYWAMLLCFLTETKLDRKYSRHRPAFAGPVDTTKQIEPHPFSGISRQMVRILTDTGLLVFRFRNRLSNTQFLSEKDLDFLRDCIREARSIERRLVAYSPPKPTDISDAGDGKATPEHFIHIDEAYRCTGLLQLYRIFPDLLDERYNTWEDDDLFHPQPPIKTPSKEERNVWLKKLALRIVSEIRQIPFESSTRCLQPFLLVAASSELRRDPSDIVASVVDDDDDVGPAPVLGQASFELVGARNFILSRLSAYMHILPLRKVSMFSDMVTSTWAALDAGEDIHWTDICKRMRFETLLG